MVGAPAAGAPGHRYTGDSGHPWLFGLCTNHSARSGWCGVRRSGIKEEPTARRISRGAECRAGLIQQEFMYPHLHEDDGPGAGTDQLWR